MMQPSTEDMGVRAGENMGVGIRTAETNMLHTQVMTARMLFDMGFKRHDAIKAVLSGNLEPLTKKKK